MAWTGVKCIQCGSEYSVQMYGPHRDREWRVVHWTGHCDECEAKHVAARNMANAAAAAANKAEGLPALEGSPKQIAWAETIRAGKLAAMAELELGPKAQAALARIRGKASASYWIDRRNREAGDWIAKAVDVMDAEAAKLAQ